MAKNLRWRGILFAGTITAMAGFVDGVGFVHFVDTSSRSCRVTRLGLQLR